MEMLIDLNTQRVDYIWCILKLDIAKPMVCSNKCFAYHPSHSVKMG